MYQCKVKLAIENLDILNGRLLLKDVSLNGFDKNQNWSCTLNSLLITWSWSHLIFDHKLSMTATLDHLATESHVTSTDKNLDLAIRPFFEKLISPSNFFIPCEITDYFLNHCTLLLTHKQGSVAGEYNLSIICANKKIKYAARLSNWDCVFNAQRIVTLKSGDFLCSTDPQKPLALTCSCILEQPDLPAKINKSLITCSLHQTTFALTSLYENGALQSSWTLHDFHRLEGHCYLPFSQLGSLPHSTANAQCTVSADLKDFATTFKAHIDITHIPHVPTISLNLVTNKTYPLLGTITLPELLNSAHSAHGIIQYDGKVLTLVANDRTNKKLGSLMLSQDGTFSGSCQYDFLTSTLKTYGIDMHADTTGALSLKGNYNSSGITTSLDVQKISLRIPGTYSIIQDIQTTLKLDWQKKIVSCYDTIIKFYKGSLVCSGATLMYLDDGTIASMYCPLLLHDYFFSWKKELFAHVSATLIAEYSHTKNCTVRGDVILEQSYIHGNILSPEFQQELFGNTLSNTQPRRLPPQVEDFMQAINFDLALVTKSPLEVQTPFLQALLNAQFNLKGSIGDQAITGKLNFLQGSLQFPYKPLFITEGSLTFAANQLDDPLIALTARNTLQKHVIELALSGSVSNPYIMLSANPHLDQEQIITLLLSGNKDGILYLAMPSMVTSTLEHLLFGPSETASKTQQYLKNLLRPLKNFHLVPSLTNQEGRGGLRGSIAFEVSDRLRARFDKNFSLTEDSTFEVEYLLSDESSVRLIRDERGDIGLEGEKRWKF